MQISVLFFVIFFSKWSILYQTQELALTLKGIVSLLSSEIVFQKEIKSSDKYNKSKSVNLKN